jgi:hypothetical protein
VKHADYVVAALAIGCLNQRIIAFYEIPGFAISSQMER